MLVLQTAASLQATRRPVSLGILVRGGPRPLPGWLDGCLAGEGGGICLGSAQPLDGLQPRWPLIEPSLLWTDAWGLLSGQWWTAEVHPRVGVPPHHLPQPIRGQHLVLVG